MSKVRNNQAGVAHIILIVVFLVILGAVGYVGYTTFMKTKAGDTKSESNTASSSKVESDCNKAIGDNDLCKFFASWDGKKNFAVTMTDTRDGVTSNSTIKIDGNKTYMKTDGEAAFEMIMVGDDTYSKTGGVWWKKAGAKADDTTSATPEVNPDDYKYDVPVSKDVGPQYKSLGKEACGKYTCFKYWLVDSSDKSGDKMYLMFDTQDYLMRKVRSESSDGAVMVQNYSYDDATVTIPTEFKTLAPNQMIIPGQSEPITIPGMD